MQDLNLPSFNFKIKQLGDSHQIFDEFRRKYIELTPEEWVRQRFLRYLVNFRNYPAGLISVEKELKIGKMKKRPDAVVFNKQGIPKMILEFKSPDVEVNEETFFQVAMYNKSLQVPWLILSNGIHHYVARINMEQGGLTWEEEIPAYEVVNLK